MTIFKETCYYVAKMANMLLSALLAVVCLFFGFLFYCNMVNMEVPTLGPYKIYIVLSDSMAPQILTDDAVIVNTSVTSDALQSGDIITFYAFESNVIITHRITGVEQSGQGVAYRTQGDGNNTEDLFITPVNRIIGRYVFKIPQLAGFMRTSAERPYFIALLVAGVVIVQALLTYAERTLKPVTKPESKKEGGNSEDEETLEAL